MRSIIVLLALLLASCGLPSIKPYKMDIQQGNAITSKMMLQLRPGMTQSQVRFILGTPLIQDSFHADRWDYFYQMRHRGKIIEQRRIILEFEKGALTRVRGDVVAASTSQSTPLPVREAIPMTKPEEKKSWLDQLKFWEDVENPKNIYIEKPLDESGRSPQQAPADLINPRDETPGKAKPAANTEPVVETWPEEKSAPARAVTPEAIDKPLPPTEVPKPALQKPAEEPVKPAVIQTQPAVKSNVVTQPQAIAPVEKTSAESIPDAEPTQQSPATTAPASQSAPEAATTIEKPAAVKPAQIPVETPAAAKKELPPEDAPGYFERLLEKIGF
jgi:outer membrane protein assembly factor BamE